MSHDLVSYFADKSVLILGCGREGLSTYNLIRQAYPHIALSIADARDISHLPQLSTDDNLQFFTGDDYLLAINEYDVIMKSPGISFKDIDTSVINGEITSQTDLFMRFYHAQCVGVTGTKGKSTCASLIYHCLHAGVIDTVLAGNIGVPFFEIIPAITPATIIVAELSAHQLEYIKHSPHLAILLNIYPEHLDYYASYACYQAAKHNIHRYQDTADYCLYYTDDSDIDSSKIYQGKSHKWAIGYAPKMLPQVQINNHELIITTNDSTRVIKHLTTKLIGEHNFINIAFAYLACYLSGLEDKKFVQALASFSGLTHRLEDIGIVDGVRYINDSISTIPQTAILAIEAIDDVDTIIVGGDNRGVNYTPLADKIVTSDVKNVILMYETGDILADLLVNCPQNVYLVEDLAKGVELAKKICTKNMTCLFSPAAASYENFKNFEERGDFFKTKVLANP